MLKKAMQWQGRLQERLGGALKQREVKFQRHRADDGLAVADLQGQQHFQGWRQLTIAIPTGRC